MAIKDIQVHVDNDAACGKRVEMAVKFVKRQNIFKAFFK